MVFSSLLPMLLMMFLYSGCASVAPESIAGEKERGTIATMLITPTKRSDIAIGKILALAIIALLSGTSISVERRLGRTEKLEQSEARDLGLRVFVGGRSAIVSSSAADPAGFVALAERAVAMARVVPEDPS